jgi:glutathione S-transferase
LPRSSNAGLFHESCRTEALMKLYDCSTAPSPRRVRVFLAEKGIAVPTVQVDLRAGEHLAPAFRAINPDCTVPVLALDDGTVIADAVAICHYFEEVQPTPPLIGTTRSARALTIAWGRRIERDGFYAVMEAFRNATPGLKGRAVPGPDDYEQIPALAERGRMRILRFFQRMDAHLARSPFVAGASYTMADITAQVTVEFAKWAKVSVPYGCPDLARWFAMVSARPSAKA